jgi:hypothetical protein
MTDGQRLDQLSYIAGGAKPALDWNQNTNSSVLSTPNMDRIAKEGAQLQNAFVTNALCAPSRGCFLTGLYSMKNGVIDNKDRPLAPNVRIISDFLHDAGYEVAFCGKSHIKGALRASSGSLRAGWWNSGRKRQKPETSGNRERKARSIFSTHKVGAKRCVIANACSFHLLWFRWTRSECVQRLMPVEQSEANGHRVLFGCPSQEIYSKGVWPDVATFSIKLRIFLDKCLK